MNNNQRRFSSVLTFIFLLLAGASATNAQDGAANGELDKLFAEEWEYTLREQPTFASHVGDPRYNDRWPDLSLAAYEKRQAHRTELLARLEQIDSKQFSAGDKLNYRLFRHQLETQLAEFPFGFHLAPLDQRDGLQTEYTLGDSLILRSAKDYEDWITRLHKFGEYTDQTIALMREGIKQKIVQPKIVMRRVPAQIRQQIVDEPSKSPYYNPLKKFPATISGEDQARLQKKCLAAITEQVIPAYRRFLEFFEQDYLPACFDEVGAWQLPKGKEFYVQRCRHFTTTNLTPDEIHNIGLSEVARIRKEMEAIQKEVKFEGTLAQFLEHLRTDKSQYYDSPEELLSGYLALCKRIDPQLTKLFKTLPRIPYGLEPIPQQIAPDTTTAYYRPPSADGRRAGTYFVNLYRPETRPKYEMEALSLHEAVPGHHLQIAIATELENVPQFRKFTGFTAYVEGWALYAERLGPELGCYQDPYSRMGQLTYEMWRAVRLVVDTGMHDKKWTRERAIQFFRENTAKTQQDIVNEVDRYIAWPGQALAYKVGEIKIRELRARAEKQLGDQFDIREFHDVVLRQGAVPLNVLEEIVDDWLAKAVSR
jgi:uncharacterized protein (DUF885 family)